MHRDFYFDLSDDVIALSEELLQCAKEWHLPIRRREKFIGIGKMHGFYMFWIARKEGMDYFKARRNYSYEQEQEIACYPLVAENRERILAAAKHIYQEYFMLRDSLPAKKIRMVTETFVSTTPWSELISEIVLSRREEAQSTTDICKAACEFASLAEEQLRFLLSVAADTRIRERNNAIWEEYVLTDENTLRALAPKYEATHEHIRQVVKKVGKKTVRLFQKYCLHDSGTGFSERNERMAELLKRTDGALIPFLCESFSDWGKRKRKFVLHLLFGEEQATMLWKECQAYQNGKLASLKKQQEILQRVTRLQEMIHYPSEVCADTQEQVQAFVMEKEYAYIASFRQKLEKMQGYVNFVQKPNIVYYSSTKTDHRPDFLLEFENGRRALVLVLPTINLAFSYNQKRFCALRDFCEKRGYGYLIVNDRNQTFEDVKQLPVDPALKSAFDAVLRSEGEILWSDIYALKEEHRFTYASIAAYVLQNELFFVMDPYFCIRHFS